MDGFYGFLLGFPLLLAMAVSFGNYVARVDLLQHILPEIYAHTVGSIVFLDKAAQQLAIYHVKHETIRAPEEHLYRVVPQAKQQIDPLTLISMTKEDIVPVDASRDLQMTPMTSSKHTHVPSEATEHMLAAASPSDDTSRAEHAQGDEAEADTSLLRAAPRDMDDSRASGKAVRRTSTMSKTVKRMIDDVETAADEDARSRPTHAPRPPHVPHMSASRILVLDDVPFSEQMRETNTDDLSTASESVSTPVSDAHVTPARDTHDSQADNSAGSTLDESYLGLEGRSSSYKLALQTSGHVGHSGMDLLSAVQDQERQLEDQRADLTSVCRAKFEQLDEDTRQLVIDLHFSMLRWKRVAYGSCLVSIMVGWLLALVFIGGAEEEVQVRWLVAFLQFTIMIAVIMTPVLLLLMAMRRQYQMHRKKAVSTQEEWEQMEADANELAVEAFVGMTVATMQEEIMNALNENLAFFVL